MSRIITQAGDPTLWNTLNNMWAESNFAGWITQGYVHWRTVVNTSGDVEFHEKETLDLLDSRSVSKSKPASYTDLE